MPVYSLLMDIESAKIIYEYLKDKYGRKKHNPRHYDKKHQMKQIIFYQMKQKKENLIEKEDKGIWLTLKYIE